MAENYYDTDRGLSEYLIFHYGGPEHRIPGAVADGLSFPVHCVTHCVDTMRLPLHARALDLGCAVGRSSFELARRCTEVLGVDFSKRFIDVATHLRDNGTFQFGYIEEGELTKPHRAIVPPEIDRRRVKFEQGNALNLREDIGQFDVMLMVNLIDRLPEPAKCLARLPSLLKPGGQLVLASPYTWMTEYTPRENWLGGFVRNGNRVYTFDTVKEVLSPDFELHRRLDLPFVIREHERKFQLGFSEATVWVRR